MERMTKFDGSDQIDLEAEIQRELDALGNENLEVELEDNIEENDQTFPDGDLQQSEDFIPESLKEYIRAVQSRAECLEEEVRDCDVVLHGLAADVFKNEDEQLAQRIKEQLGAECQGDPLELRNQVLTQLEEEERREEEERGKEEVDQNEMAIDVFRADIFEEFRVLEQEAEKKLKELEEKQAMKERQRRAAYEEMREEEEARRLGEREARQHRQRQLEVEQRKLADEQKALRVKYQEEIREEQKKFEHIRQQFQVELKALEEEKERETEVFLEMQAKEAKYQDEKRSAAATMIQKHYRGHRIYKEYKSALEQRRRERIRRRKEELDRIERVEERIREETKRKKVEEEEEKKRKAAEENERKEEEQKRKEQETRRQKEEEKRLKELDEKRKEEEKKKTEEDRRKAEEETKRREREENEKRKREAEERKKKLLEEEKRKRELEQKKIEEEERKRKKELENKIQEEEARNKADEEKRKCEEERKREEEETKKKLEEKRRLEEEEKRKEEEERKQMEEKIRRIESEKKRREEQTRKEEVLLKEGRDLKSGLFLLLEERRLQWVKEHLPWNESTVEERTQPVARTRPRRPFSASKKLPVLTEGQLVHSSPPGTPVYKVKTIHLRGLSGCSMQGLNNCPSLRSLTLNQCGLLAVEGLEQCKELQELRVQENKVESVNCRELSSLAEILLSDNNLTSLQGLVGCTSLRWLGLNKNKFTRIGDLSSCPKIQSLSLDHNQLIMTKGLSKLARLQNLSCSHNHLSHVKEIESCVLLQTLNFQSNNLQEPPQLTNHVLLRELWLDDNSISSLAPLASSWLPLLQVLSVSQNSIPSLDPLNGLIVLETLDVRHNLISDVEGVVNGVRGCDFLRTLNTEGNPAAEEPDYRETILKILPKLITLDAVSLTEQQSSHEPPPNISPFLSMCVEQIRIQDDMQRKFKTGSRDLDEGNEDTEHVMARLKLKNEQFENCYQLAVKHLQQHEKFNPERYKSSTKTPTTAQPAAHGTQPFGTPGPPRRQQDHSLSEVKLGQKVTSGDERDKHAAATKIQSLWRGWNFRHEIEVRTERWLAAVTIQSVWRGYWARSQLMREGVLRRDKHLWDDLHHRSATVIQAHYRGHRVRRHLSKALRSARESHDMDEDDFNYDEEVDLGDFDLDETALDHDWAPAKTPQLPSRGPVLRAPPSLQHKMVKPDPPILGKDASYPNSEWWPKQAWRSADSPIANPREAPQVLQVAMETPDQDQVSITSGTQSHLSHRAEELSNEWGFHSAATAELMMKRAKRMKYNAVRKKKLLDPNKRLALFKRLEETNKLRDVRPPPRHQQAANRVEYFVARDSVALPSGSTTPTSEREAKAQLTYSWVYKQAVIHEDEQDIMSGRKDYVQDSHKSKQLSEKRKMNISRSPVNLPHVDPVFLSGRPVPLVSSPLTLRSVDENSQDGNSVTTERRHSLSSDSRLRFPPIKTHSVPNLTARSTLGAASGLSQEKKSNSAGARMGKEKKQRR